MIFNITMNERYDVTNLSQRWGKLVPKERERLLSQPEDENMVVVPSDHYSEEAMRKYLPFYTAACLETYGLELHQQTLNVPGIQDFLAVRFHFWEDDVEHEDFFKSATA